MVYEEPCAEHCLAMMLALARRLPQCLLDQQRPDHPWQAAEHRIGCRLLVGQTVLILGYGAIGRRLAELLQPLRMNVIAVRRTVRGDEAGRVVAQDQLDELLPEADHVVNTLPENPQTVRSFTSERFNAMKPGAIFYNVGRGTTVDQEALQVALETGKLAAAYLDVTNPEPLPRTHPLWTTQNCFITPHTAGGHHDEFERLVRHFLGNLERFEGGKELMDRVG
jgi:phosphoglycerate dehydrogenase-like enzyme